jgi:dTDP-4-dehydrorhamnose reductase
MKVLVTGVKGQLGYDVCKVLDSRGIENNGVDLNDFDITDSNAVVGYINSYKPDVVIHCSAFTAVDMAEDKEELCYAVNVDGTRNIAFACKHVGAKMMYFSTDYVFPGIGERFYEPDDATGPLSVYGKTKLSGELEVQRVLERYFICRLSWVFGKNGNNFVKTMLKLSATNDGLNVVDDQIGSPTYTADAAQLVCDMIMTEKYGIYHVTNEGVCSWAEFADEIFRQVGRNVKVNHIPTSEYPTRATRPHNSRLSKEKLVQMGFFKLPTWQDALARYLQEI